MSDDYALKSFSSAYWSDAKFLGIANTSGDLDTAASYAAVPFVNAAIAHIAGALSTLPITITRGQEDVTAQFTPPGFSDMLYLDAAWQLLFGASYFKPSANKFGASQFVGLFPPQMQYRYNLQTGELDRFDFIGTPKQSFAPDDRNLIWQWWPNVTGTQGPGVCPAAVALGDANVLYRLGQFVTAYFMRGGPVTLLTVEGNPPDLELQKIEKWWARVTQNVKAFFKGIAIRAGIKPVTFGSSIKDSTSVEVQTQARENVVIAFGIPLTIIMSNYANYATADLDALMMYENAVMPLARRIRDVWNIKWFGPQGVKLDWNEETLPVYQNRFLQLASAVVTLATPITPGQPAIIDANEARIMLGKKPRPVRVLLAGEVPATPAPDGTTTPGAAPDASKEVNNVLTNLSGRQQINLSRIIRQFGQGKLQQAQAEILLTGGFGVTLAEAQTLLGIGDTETQTIGAVASVDLERWQRKATSAIERGKSAAVPFASDTILAVDHERISTALAECKTVDDVRAVFQAGGQSEIAALTHEIREVRKALENSPQ